MMEEWLLLKDGGICRCCALEGPSKDLVSKYSWMGDDEIYSDMLRECFNITLVTVEEGSNGGICEVCITQLRSAYKFRQHVLHTEEQFKKKLESKNLCDSAFVKLEIPPETSDTDMDPMGDNDDNSDYEVPLKKIKDELESEMELMKQKKTPAKTIASKSTRTLKKKASVEPETSKSKSKRVPVYGISDNRKEFINFINILKFSNASVVKCIDSRGFGCQVCPATFPEAIDLKNHFAQQHRNNKYIRSITARSLDSQKKLDISFLKCLVCNAKMDSLDVLIDHLKDVHGKELYSEVKNRILPLSFEEPGLHCVVCRKEFASFKTMLQHMHDHFINCVCPICGAGFVNQKNCSAHIRRHATGQYPCGQCKKIFDSKPKLTDHIDTVHLHKKKHRCEFCLERFDDAYKKYRHLVLAHGQKMKVFKCQECDKEYRRANSLKQHIRKSHLNEKNQVCAECGKHFFSSTVLKEHLISHGIGRQSLACKVCSKVYTRLKTLKAHMKSHNEKGH